jgi:hypothetical protein
VVNSHPLYQLSYRGVTEGNLTESYFNVNEIVQVNFTFPKQFLDKASTSL